MMKKSKLEACADVVGSNNPGSKCSSAEPIGKNIIDLCSSIWEKIWTISEVEFAVKQEGAKFLQVGTIKHASSLSLTLLGMLDWTTVLIALAIAVTLGA